MKADEPFEDKVFNFVCDEDWWVWFLLRLVLGVDGTTTIF